MVPSEATWHVSRGHKRVLKLVNFLVQNLQKPYMIDLGTNSPLIYDNMWSICHIVASGHPFKTVLWFCTHVAGQSWHRCDVVSVYENTEVR